MISRCWIHLSHSSNTLSVLLIVHNPIHSLLVESTKIESTQGIVHGAISADLGIQRAFLDVREDLLNSLFDVLCTRNNMYKVMLHIWRRRKETIAEQASQGDQIHQSQISFSTCFHQLLSPGKKTTNYLIPTTIAFIGAEFGNQHQAKPRDFPNEKTFGKNESALWEKGNCECTE